jgi:hypothetical protein
MRHHSSSIRVNRAYLLVPPLEFQLQGLRESKENRNATLYRRSLMNRRIVGMGFLFFVAGACGYAGAQRGGGGRQSPMAKLMNDLQQAAPRAKLSDDQNEKLQSDLVALKDAQQAKRQGQSVDQDKVQAALNDLHQIVDGGAFQDADQKQLDQDFTAIQPPQ